MEKIDRFLNQGSSTTAASKHVRIEYDEKQYEVEIVGNYAILKSKLYRDSSESIHVFDLDKVCIIKQVNKDRPYFITISRTGIGMNDILTVYYDCVHELEKIDEIPFAKIEKIKDGVYIITEGSGFDSYIYNLNKQSNSYSRHCIETDSHIMDYIDPKYHNTVLVTEKLRKGIAEDRITYGIDLDTFDIVTNIFSEEQQRYIKKYNSRETIKYIAPSSLNDVGSTSGLATKEGEVEKYLKLLNEQGIYTFYPNQDKEMYVYDENDKHVINKTHLKNLKRRYYDENFKPRKNRSN